MNKKTFLVMLMLVVIIVFSSVATPVKKDTYRIAFIPKSTISSFWKITIDGFNTAISEYNAYGEIRSTENEEDFEQQSQIVRDVVAEGFNAIVISAISYEQLAEPVTEAMKAGVEVVVIDSDVNVPNVKVRVSTDNYDAGFKMGEKMAELLEYKGEIGVLAFDTVTQNAKDRIDGFYGAIEQYDEIIVCDHAVTASNELISQQITETMIMEHPEIDGIATFNEIITVGMGKAVEKFSKKELICVGFDNNFEVVDFLEREILDVTIIQNQFAMGYLGAEYAIKLLDGEKYENLHVDTGTEVVTRENMLELQTVLFPFYIDQEYGFSRS